MNQPIPDATEPYSIEWMRSIGFDHDDQDTEGVNYYWINAGYGRTIFDLQYHPDAEEGERWIIANENGDLLLNEPGNKGGVLDLLRVLNIPTKAERKQKCKFPDRCICQVCGETS